MKLIKINQDHYELDGIKVTDRLSEVKELLGEVDVEKKALELYELLNKEYFSTGQKAQLPQTNKERQAICDGFILGYNQCLEDNKEKKYTEEDLSKAIIKAWYQGAKQSYEGKTYCSTDDRDEIIQSLQPKAEWEVEFIDGKLKLL